MASRHVSKVIARAASVVVEALERRQLLAFSTLELFTPSVSDSQTSTALPNVLVYTPEPAARATVGGGVRLAWPAVNGARNGYEIHRRTGDGAYEMIATVRGNAALGRLGGRVSYLDLDVQPGEAYTYRVRGVGPASTRGEWSETISVLTDRKAAQAGFGRTAAMVAASARLAAYATSGSTAQLAWSKRPIGATGYEIQRRFGDYDYATIATLSSEEAVTDINGQIAFEDTQLLEGEGYTYRIRALGVTGNAASWSNEYGVLIPQVSRTTDSFVLPSQGTTVTLNTTEDTHARGGTGATSYFGNDVWNGAKLATGDEHREAFYKFNLSSLSGAVTGVKIRFNGRLSASDGTKTFLVKAVSNTSWTEAGLNYNNRPGTDATLGSFNVSSTSDGWYEVDVTSYINAERALNHTTVAFAVVGAATSTAYFRINSRESGSNSAQLTVTLDASTSLRTPTDDTHARSGTGATSIFGSDVWNGAKLGTGDEHREGFYKFNLSGFTGDLEQAVIRFYGHLNTTDGTRTFSVQSLSNTSWSESSLTYNNRPTTGRTNLGSFNVSSTSDGWYQVDVTSYIASQLAASQSVASFAVIGNANSTAYFWINSKESGLSSAQLVLTKADVQPPATPGSLQATQTGAPVVLAWPDVSDETGYVIQRSTSSSFTSPVEFTAGANTTSYPDWSIAGNTTYYYRVKAVKSSLSSGWSPTASTTTANTTTASSSATADTFVRDGTYAGTNYGTYNDLSVKTGPTDFTRYAYLKFDLSSFTSSVLSAKLKILGQRSNTVDANLQFAVFAVDNTSWNEMGMTYDTRPTLGNQLATFAIQNTMSAVEYQIDLTSYIADKLANNQSTLTLAVLGVQQSDAQFTFKSRETTNAPALEITSVSYPAPSNLHRVIPDDVAPIAIAWNDNSSDETGFAIQRKVGASGTWVSLASNGANDTDYDDLTYDPTQDHFYRVQAVKGGLGSAYSNESIIPARPAAPTVGPVTASSVTLTWTDVSAVETGYYVERRLGAGSWLRLNSSSPVSAVAGSASYTDDAATRFNTYEYRVRAVSSTDEGLPGAASSATPTEPLQVGVNPASPRYEGSLTTLTATFPSGTAPAGTTYIWNITRDGAPFATNVSTGISNIHGFTPTDEGVYAATVTASVGLPGSISGINVVNANPTASITGVPMGSVNEGSAISLGSTSADAGATDVLHYAWSVSKDGVAFTLPGGTVSNASTFTFTPTDNGSYVVTLVVSDEDNGSVSVSTAAITVDNVAPTASVDGEPVNAVEGDTVSVTSTVADAGTADTHSYAWSVTKNGSAFALPGGTATNASTFAFVPTDNGTYVISLTVTDDDSGAVTVTSDNITVTNAAPTGSITGPTTGNEGSAVTLTANVSDTGSTDTYTYLWNVTKAGQAYDLAGATVNAVTLTFTTDDDATYVATCVVTDDDNGTLTLTHTLTIANVDPTISITGAPTTGQEGTAISVGSTVADPGHETFSYGWTIRKNDEPIYPDGVGFTGETLTFTPTDNGTYKLRLTVLDGDGGTASVDTDDIVVDNVNPTTIISGEPTGVIHQGDPVDLIATPSDAGTDDSFSYSWSVTRDAASYTIPADVDTESAAFSFTPQEIGSYIATVVVTDDDGGFITVDSEPITVDAAPLSATIAGIPTEPLQEGDTVTLTAQVSYADPAHTLTYAWSVTSDVAGYELPDWMATDQREFSFIVPDNGSYEVGLVVTDTVTSDQDEDIAALDVANFNPAIQLYGDETAGAGRLYELKIAVADVGTDSVSQVLIDWGDNSDPDSDGQVGQVVTDLAAPIPHTYQSVGTYTIHAAVTDEDGVHTAPTFDVEVGTPPNPPTNVVAAAGGSTAVSVSWAAPAGDVSGYRVERMEGGGDWVLIDETHTAATTYIDRAFVMNTSLRYRVAAVNQFGASEATEVTADYTTGNGGLEAPSSVSAVAVTPTSASIEWEDQSESESGFQIEAAANGGGYSIVGHAPADATRYVAEGLVDGAEYIFRVSSAASFGASSGTVSDSLALQMLTPAPLFAALSGTSASLSWGSNSASATYFKIQYHVVGESWEDAPNADAAATETTIGNLQADSAYEFRIRAANAATSQHSNWSYASGTSGVAVPEIVISGDMLEGEPVELSVDFEDPAPPQQPTIAWSLSGDGELTGADSAAATFIPDDDGYFVASLSITYASGMTQTISKAFHLDDVAPVASISGDNSVTPGQTYTLELNYDDTDADPATSWVIDWDDGTPVQSITGSPDEASHTYASPGSYTVSAKVISDGEPYVVVPRTVSVEGEGSGAVVTIAQRLELSQSPVPATLTLHSVSTTWLKLNCSVTDGSRPQLEMRGPNDANYHDTSVPAAMILAENPVNIADLVPNTLYRFRLRTDKSGSVAYANELEIRTEQLPSTGDTIIDLPVPQNVRVVGPVLYAGADVLYKQYQPPLDANGDPIGYVNNAELLLTSNDPLGIIQAWIQSQVQQDQTDVWLNDPLDLDSDSLLNFKIDPSPYTYKAKVRATGELNGVNGASEWSEWTNEFQYFPQYTPPAPQLSTELNPDGSTTISWPYDAGFDTDFNNEGDVTQIQFYVLNESAPASSQLLTGAWSRDGSVTVDVPDGTKIVAVARKDWSGWGEYSQVITIGAPEVPSAPRDLEGFYSESVGVRLVWTNRPNNENHYEVERSSNGVSFTKIGEAGADVTTFVDTNAQFDARSWYRVRAANSDGNSGYSNLVLVAPQSGATLDLDVDSNNDGKIDPNNKSGFGTDDPIEEDEGTPGQILTIDEGDDDLDKVPGFAEALDRNPSRDDDNVSTLRLQPLNLTLPSGLTNEEPEDATLQLDYSGSSPEQVIVSGNGTDESPFVYTLNPEDQGILRIWAIDPSLIPAGQILPGAMTINDLMFIEPGQAYAWEDLAGKRFFIQAVKPTTNDEQRVVTATLTVDHDDETTPYTDTVRVTASRFDLDVITRPAGSSGLEVDRSDRAEKDEADSSKPGQVLVVNDADRDVDGIPDLADGFDATDSENDGTSASTRFSPLLIEIPADADLSTAALSLAYSASDPANLRSVGTAFSPAYAPAEGTLRIWLKDGNLSRSKLNALTGQGDFVGAGEYSGAALSRLPITVDENGSRYIKLWVEAVRASSALGAETVMVGLRLNKTNPLSLTLTDSARFTVIQSKVSEARDGLVSTADGSFRYESRDFDLAGWTGNFGQGLLFTDAPEYVLSTGNDAATSVAEWPKLVNAGSSMMVLIGGQSYFFDFIPENPNTPWKARFAGHQKLVQTEGGDFKFVTDRGETWIFKGFGESLKAIERGQFKKYVSVGGQAVTVTAFDSEGRIQTASSGTATLEYTYVESGDVESPDSEGELKTVTANRGADTLYKVTYTYYEKTDQYGGAHDVMSASIEMGTAVVEKKRFLYTKSPNPDQRSVLQSVIEGRNYARALRAGLDLASKSVTPAQVSAYASFVRTAGAVYTPETGTVYIADGTHPDALSGPNAWHSWHVETHGDLVTTVFSNSIGQPMIVAAREIKVADKSQVELSHLRYDARHLLIQEASGLAVSGYAQDMPDLVSSSSNNNAVFLSDQMGLVRSYEYDDAGRVTSESIRNGESGAPIKLRDITYVSVGVDGISQPSTETLYTGAMPATRVTHYAYDSEQISHNLPNKITTTRPDGTTTLRTYNVFGRLLSATDADNITSTNTWNNELGIASIQTVDTGAQPAHLNLSTYTDYDKWGRPTKVTDPKGRETTFAYQDGDDKKTTTITRHDGKIDVVTDQWWLGFTQTLTKTPDSATIVAASRTYLDLAGRPVSDDQYYHIPMGEGTDESWGTRSAADTFADFHRTAYEYDSMGRLTTTIDGSNVSRKVIYDGFGRPSEEKLNGITVREYSYIDDRDTGASYRLTAEIPGNGRRRYTTDYYDWRGRTVATRNAAQLSWVTYSNLDEAVAIELFDASKNRVNGNVSGVPVRQYADAGRISKTTTTHNSLGLVSRTEQHSVAADGTVSAGLVTIAAYNGRAQSKEVISPSGLSTKTAYDGAGRPVDVVIEAGESAITKSHVDYDRAGNAVRTMRSDYGPAGVRNSYVRNIYNTADQIVASVDYGTNGGVVVSPTDELPARAVFDGRDQFLRTDYTYDAAGHLETVTDARGVVTKHETDALGRNLKTITNFSNGAPSDYADATQLFEYNGAGQQTLVTTLQPKGAVSRTKYFYNASGQLSSVEFPAAGGHTGGTGNNEVYTYNQLGERVTKQERNGVVHMYTHDELGRVTADRATVPQGSIIDDRLKAIVTQYDAAGRIVSIKNQGNRGGEIRRTYNGLGQLEVEWQEIGRDVDTSASPVVTYSYKPVAEGAGIESISYPNGRTLTYSYSAVDGAAGRPTSMHDSEVNQTVESYEYLGLTQVVSKVRPQIGLSQQYYGQSGAPDSAGDSYTGLDRFGRIIDHGWKLAGAYVDRFQYDYDAGSNVLVKKNLVNPQFSELYHSNGNVADATGGNPSNVAYDHFGRLRFWMRGQLGGTSENGRPNAMTTDQRHQSWVYDSRGNWTQFFDGKRKNVTAFDTRSLAYGAYSSEGGGTPEAAAYIYDAAGNLQQSVKSVDRKVTYDAWGRTVSTTTKVGTSKERVDYLYDPLGRVVAENQHEYYYDQSGRVITEANYYSGERHHDMDTVWGVDGKLLYVEEDSAPDNNFFRQYAVDDGMGNTTSVVTGFGTAEFPFHVGERFIYDPHGRVMFLYGSWKDYRDSSATAPYDNASNHPLNRPGLRVLWLFGQQRWSQLDRLYHGNAGTYDPTVTMSTQPSTKIGSLSSDDLWGRWLVGNNLLGRTIDLQAAELGVYGADVAGETWSYVWEQAQAADWSAFGHAALDAVGILDPFGIADGINAAWYLTDGDYMNAAVSLAGMIPYAGDAAKAGRLGSLGLKVMHGVDAAKGAISAVAHSIAPVSRLAKAGPMLNGHALGSTILSMGVNATVGAATGFGFAAGSSYVTNGNVDWQASIRAGLIGAGEGLVSGAVNPYICFVAGTQVVVGIEAEDATVSSVESSSSASATGTKLRYKTIAIEDLVARGGGEMGDGRTSTGAAQMVLSRDQHDPDGPLVRARVSRTYQRTAYALQVLTVRDEDGVEQTLRVTEEHPFFVRFGGWTPAKSLEAGDTLLGAEGTLTVVANEHEAHPQGVAVYNLEVEQAHTYFVLAEGANDAAAVWVHNASETYKAMIVGDAGHHVPGVRKTQGRTFEVSRSDMDLPTIHVIGDDAARAQAHWRMHDAERLHVGPRQGAFQGTDAELFEAYRKSYQGLTDIRVNVRSRNGRVVLGENTDLLTAVSLLEKHLRG